MSKMTKYSEAEFL